MFVCSVRSLPSESYEFTLCDERTPQIHCIACHQHSATGSLLVATGGQQLKLWTQSTADSNQLTYACVCLHFEMNLETCSFLLDPPLPSSDEL